MCGCPVLTTDDTPMNEISGPAAMLVGKYTRSNHEEWCVDGMEKLKHLVHQKQNAPDIIEYKCIAWASNFEQSVALGSYFEIYKGEYESRG